MIEPEHAHVYDPQQAAAGLRVLSWNVGQSGLAALAAGTVGGLKVLLDSLQSDIICLQETKLAGEAKLTRELAVVDGYHAYFSHCTAATGSSLVRAGYAGTATYVRSNVRCLSAAACLGAPLAGPAPPAGVGGGGGGGHPGAEKVFEPGGGLPAEHLVHIESAGDAGGAAAEPVVGGGLFGRSGSGQRDVRRRWELDNEGRALLTEHGGFVVVNVYCPAGGRDQDRPGYKLAYHTALQRRCEQLRAGGRCALVVGDLNVAPTALDRTAAERQAHPEWLRSAAVGWFEGCLTDLGWVDCFRRAHPGRAGAYSCWSVLSRSRETNTGARLDHILATTPALAAAVTNCDVQQQVLGSDHCPIFCDVIGALLLDSARRDGSGGRAAVGVGFQPASALLVESPALSAAALSAGLRLLFHPVGQPAARQPVLCAGQLARWVAGAGQSSVLQWLSTRPPPLVAGSGPAAVGSSSSSATGGGAGGAGGAGVQSAVSSRRRSAAGGGQRSLEAMWAAPDGSGGGANRAAGRRREPEVPAGEARSGRVAVDTAEVEAAEMREAIRRSLADAKVQGGGDGEAGGGGEEVAGGRGAGGGGGWAGVLGAGAAAAASASGWRCRHGEPARCYETADKRSPHYGRRFWACDHERHPKGDWLADPTESNLARCNFWRWDPAYRGFKRKATAAAMPTSGYA